MEVGQGPNWGCSAKEKKKYEAYHVSPSRGRGFFLKHWYLEMRGPLFSGTAE
jgi:hypothetical protein